MGKMMGKRHKLAGAMLLVAMAMGSTNAIAADAPMIVADARAASAQPRFISLTAARQGPNSVRVVSPAMKSDRAMMNAGFMRLDRERMQRVRIQRPASPVISMAAPRAVPASVNVSRTKDPVLELFGETGNIEVPARVGRTQHAWPLPTNVTQKFTSGFGSRKDPFHGRDSFHGGIDLAAAVGTPVLASADGVVTKVENGSRYGKYVSVRHRDGSESSYGHLSAQSVRVGQNVRQGQKVGELGSTGRSTGPHLDYRIKRNGELFNPMTVLRQPAITTQRVASRGNGLSGRGGSTINGVKIIR